MKKILILTLALVMALSLAACGGSGNDNSGASQAGGDTPSQTPPASGQQQESSGGDFSYGDGEDYIEAHLTGDFSITYRFTKDGQESYDHTLIRTSEGFYISAAAGELLLIKVDDKNFEVYSGSLEKGFTKAGMQVTQTGVDGYISDVTEYMMYYGKNVSKGMKSGESGTVTGRDCDGFYIDDNGKYEYWIDKATGVCLKFNFDGEYAALLGIVVFECTGFTTSDVTLPSYK